MCAQQDYAKAVSSFDCIQASAGGGISPLLSDEAVLQVVHAHLRLRKPSSTLLPLLQRSRAHLLPRSIGLLVRGYCEAGKLNIVESILVRWLDSACEHTLGRASSGGGATAPPPSDWNTILQSTLQGYDAMDRTAAFGPLHDMGAAQQLLSLLQSRRRMAAGPTAGGAPHKPGDGKAAAEVPTAAVAAILQMAGPSFFSFPDLSVWSALAKMYASRNQHHECMLVLDVCIAGTANTSFSSSRELQSIYDSTVKVMCSSMQFRKAIHVHQQSCNTPGLATSELRHLGYMLRYLSELEAVDDQVLRLTSSAAQAVLHRRSDSACGSRNLAHAVVALLCKHGHAELAAQFVEREEAYLSSATTVIRSLTRSGHLEKALALFIKMVEQHATLTPRGAAVRSAPDSLDAACHDLCGALRHDPKRLAWFVSSYMSRI